MSGILVFCLNCVTDCFSLSFQSVVHVSTAFCQSHRDVIEEAIEPLSPGPNQVIEALR